MSRALLLILGLSLQCHGYRRRPCDSRCNVSLRQHENALTMDNGCRPVNRANIEILYNWPHFIHFRDEYDLRSES